jgi:transposase
MPAPQWAPAASDELGCQDCCLGVGRRAERLDRQPEMMKLQRRTVEHPLGTIKHWMGWNHFITKTLTRVSTEMSLHVLAYNLKRAMRFLGIEAMLHAMQA